MKAKIYQLLRKIPKGKVISYKTLADFFGTSPRAIGKIMNCNADPVNYPCYKVVKSTGELGGYNGGVEKKKKLLESDKIQIIEGKISKSYFRKPSKLKTQRK